MARFSGEIEITDKEAKLVDGIIARAPENKRQNEPAIQKYGDVKYNFEIERTTYNTRVKQFPWNYVAQPMIGTCVQGWNCHTEAGNRLKDLGVKHAYIVTTGLRGTGIVEEMQAVLKQAGVAYTVGPLTHSNPRVEDAVAGVKAFKEAGCDGVLSVGGGSSHDTGKGIRLLLSNPGKTIFDARALLQPHWITASLQLKYITTPQVAINTTCGTGAEITPFAVYTDWANRWKFNIMANGGMQPNVGYDDPLFFRCMPEHIAAQSGIDSLVHGLGGVMSKLENESARAVGLHAVKLTFENLAEFVYNRWNDKACENMCWAQHLGACTYALGGGVGLIHALAHQISAINDMHHGMANAVFMVEGLKMNKFAAPQKMAMMARNCAGIDIAGLDKWDAAQKFIDACEKLRNGVGITDVRLSTYGLTADDCYWMSKHAVNDLNLEANVRDLTEPEIEAMLVGML